MTLILNCRSAPHDRYDLTRTMVVAAASSSLRRCLATWLWFSLLATLAGCQRSLPAPAADVTASTARRVATLTARSADQYSHGRLLLNSASLTAGIPGEGPLNLDDIRNWLADRSNHEILDVALPLGLGSGEDGNYYDPPAPLTRAKIELGRQLFFDPRLSGDGKLACATCHSPKQRFTSDMLAHPRLREPAVVFNRALGTLQFWDGRANSLEDQVRFTLEHHDEMNTTVEACVARVRSIEGYRLQFEAVFQRVDFAAICEALAAFERSLVTSPSAWDLDVDLRRLEQETQTASEHESHSRERDQSLPALQRAVTRQPLSDAARRGAELFFSERTGCARCHSGPNFSDEDFHDIGLREQKPDTFTVRKEREDLGRFQVTEAETDRYAFKTPTLRNVELTAPYMHDGRFDSLEATIAYFVRGGDGNGHELAPLPLSREETRDLIAFLRALTSDVPQPCEDRLPP
jgi:cytochrome c peroxidase